MTEGTCIVAADVGNSAVKLCVCRTAAANIDNADLIDHSIAITDSHWSHQAIGWIRDHAGCRQTHWRIASVHRGAADELESAVSGSSLDARISRVTHRNVPMTVAVDQPDRLGIDRLIGAYAAANRYQHPLVVVDAGSAVTVDWVDENKSFCGGAILPGLRLQTQALASGTDALPQINWQTSAELRAPSTNTVDAIHLGVLTGLAAGIDRLAAKYLEQAEPPRDKADEEDFYIVLTGGDASTLSRHMYGGHVVIPNLVCRGLLDLPE